MLKLQLFINTVLEAVFPKTRAFQLYSIHMPLLCVLGASGEVMWILKSPWLFALPVDMPPALAID